MSPFVDENGGTLALKRWFARHRRRAGDLARKAAFAPCVDPRTLPNPKAILFAGTIFPRAAFESLTTYLEAMAIFTILLLPIGLAWIALGSELGSNRLIRISPVEVQRCASIILAAFSLSLMWVLLRR